MLLQPTRSGGVLAWKGPWDCPVAIPVVSLSGSGVASVGGLLPGHPLSPLVGRVCACVAFRLPMCRRLSGSSLHSGGHRGVRSLLRAPPCPPRIGPLHLPTDETGRRPASSCAGQRRLSSSLRLAFCLGCPPRSPPPRSSALRRVRRAAGAFVSHSCAAEGVATPPLLLTCFCPRPAARQHGCIAGLATAIHSPLPVAAVFSAARAISAAPALAGIARMTSAFTRCCFPGTCQWHRRPGFVLAARVFTPSFCASSSKATVAAGLGRELVLTFTPFFLHAYPSFPALPRTLV